MRMQLFTRLLFILSSTTVIVLLSGCVTISQWCAEQNPGWEQDPAVRVDYQACISHQEETRRSLAEYYRTQELENRIQVLERRK